MDAKTETVVKDSVNKVLYVTVILLTLYASCVRRVNNHYRAELKKVKKEIAQLEKKYNILKLQADTMSTMVDWIQIYTETQLSGITSQPNRPRNPVGTPRARKQRITVNRN